MTKTYTAFISYSHRDSAMVAKLQRALENYRIPPNIVAEKKLGTNRLGTFFRDRDELSAGTDLNLSLQTALTASEHLIVVCSPSAAQSGYIAEEIRFFQSLGRAENILCVIAEGEQNLFPEPLRFALDSAGQLDRQHPLEPLAADLRKSGDGLHGAKLKLAATILSVGYDELARREQASRQRKLRSIAAGASIGMLLMTGLAFYALVQRNQAQEQRSLAEREALRAGRVLEFVVGTFQAADPAAENPKLVTALQILERGRDRLADDLETEPAVKATLQATVAALFTQLANYSDAAALYEEALAADVLPPVEQAENRLQLASVKYYQRRLKEVLPDIELAQQQLQTLLAQPLLSVLELQDLQLLQAKTELLLGRYQRYDGQYEEAKTTFSTALATFQALQGDDYKGTVEAKSELHSTLIDLGEHDESLRLVNQVVAHYRETVGENHSYYAQALQHRGNLFVAMKRESNALSDYSEALKVLNSVLGEEHPETARVHFNLGRLYLGQNEALLAHESFGRALSIGVSVFGRVHGFNCSVLQFDAHARAKLGRLDYALAALAEAAELADQIYPPNHPTFGYLITQRGVVYGEVGQTERARQLCQQGVDQFLATPGISPVTVQTARADCARWLSSAD